MIIKQIALEQRPRERLKEKGAEILSDAELLAILLQNGSKGENVIELGNRLISVFEIGRLNSLSLNELTKIKGVGLAKASKLIAAFELSKRVNSGRIYDKVVKSPSDIVRYYIHKLEGLKKECFIVLLLDSKNRVMKEETVSVGTLNASLIHPREVFRSAIKESANSVILLHNHPSGDPSPSTEDKRVTRLLSNAGELLDINVLDHIIIGKEKSWSFVEKRIILS